MFRFEDHMPNYWLNESRDFLLLTRIDDILFMGLRADIATIQNLNDSKKCKNTFLNLLAKKVGFFTDKLIEENVLRNIIGAFKIAIKHKGTKLGIEYAVRAILKAEKQTGVPEISIDNTNKFNINIFTPQKVKNIEALNEFLKYIIPAGFTYNIISYTKSNTPISRFNNIDRIIAASMNIATMASLRPPYSKNDSGYLIKDIPASDEDRFSDEHHFTQALTPLNYIRKTYAGSMNAGLIASLTDLQKAIGDDAELKNAESAKLYKSNNNIDNGIEIKP